SDGKIDEPGSELSGIPIGIEETVEYEQHTIQLEPGELLVLYTDGLNEACNTQDEQYGIDRIHEVVSKTGSQPSECGTALVEQLKQFQQDVPQEDDMCLVVFARSDEEG
ncbi:MAG: PP2C family protein-serine/threonine phosphatase, partial [Planctomycetota bacterium]|nr:PP2C family protein-serine/threonine phosphatase [Planctomycetota bacterium]